MGHKGVSIRKPKKSRPSSNTNIKGSNVQTGTSLSVQELVQDRNAPFNRAGLKPSDGSKKNRNKGKWLPVDLKTPVDLTDSKEKKMKLYLLFIVMDLFTLLAYPIVFLWNILGQFSKENLLAVKV